jgi:hypothetical protein
LSDSTVRSVNVIETLASSLVATMSPWYTNDPAASGTVEPSVRVALEEPDAARARRHLRVLHRKARAGEARDDVAGQYRAVGRDEVGRMLAREILWDDGRAAELAAQVEIGAGARVRAGEQQMRIGDENASVGTCTEVGGVGGGIASRPVVTHGAPPMHNVTSSEPAYSPRPAQLSPRRDMSPAEHIAGHHGQGSNRIVRRRPD